MEKEEFNRLMQEFYQKVNQYNNLPPKDDYNLNFIDGSKKAEEVLAFLRDVKADLNDLAYISIGGADGSEVFHILDNTPIKQAIILEYDSDFVDQINKKKYSNLDAYKDLIVLEGDAWGHRGKCFEYINKWRRQGLRGIIVSAFSVLHELPYRSAKDYRHSEFIRPIIGNIKEAYFYCKEPSKIVEWEGQVTLNIPDWLSPEQLYRLSRFTQEKFQGSTIDNFHGQITEAIDGVYMDAQLAGEVIRKILYFLKNKSSDTLTYEFGECHAALDPVEFGNDIISIFNKEDNSKFYSKYGRQSTSSETLNSLFRSNHIKLIFSNSNDRFGWQPNGFVRLFAFYRLINESKLDVPKLNKSKLTHPGFPPATSLYASDEVRKKLIKYGSESSLAIDDSIQLTPLNLNGRSETDADCLEVESRIPSDLHIQAGNMNPTNEELNLSIEHFDHEIRDYLQSQPSFRAKPNLEWKLGIELVSPRADIPKKKPLEIVVRPLSFLATDLFNRQIIKGRVAVLGGVKHPNPDLEVLYEECIQTLLSNNDSYNFLYPSQLFVELAIVTSDQQILLIKKKAGKNSGVIADLGRAWTCGPEFGLTFEHLHNGNSVLLHKAVTISLKREFGVDTTEIKNWHIAGLCLQHVHLNTALYGYCEIYLTGQQLVERFKENNSNQFYIDSEYSGPLYPELIKLNDLQTILAEEQRYDGKSWHPTAKIRLYSLLNHYAK